MHGHHEATIRLAGVTLGRELRALALSHTAPVRHGTAGELGQKVAYRQRPHSASVRMHRDHQLLSEEHVGRAVPGLAHCVGPEWRGAHAGCSRTARARCAMAYASTAQAVHSRVYGGCTAEVAASEAPGPRVSGCMRAFGYFGPYPGVQGIESLQTHQQSGTIEIMCHAVLSCQFKLLGKLT